MPDVSPSRSRRSSGALVCSVALAVTLVVAGCAGSSGDDAGQPTTSFRYLVDPLEPGTGFIQLGQNRYPFDGVICATGPVKSDPEGSIRDFGVYANFTIDSTLAAVSLTRYRNEIHGETNSVPTLTETALIQMQGDKEIRGLSAKRYQIVGARKWQDPNDPTATTPLITHTGDRYVAKGTFAPVNADVEASPTTTGSSVSASSDAVIGQVAARCPAESTTTTSSSGTDATGSPQPPATTGVSTTIRQG